MTRALAGKELQKTRFASGGIKRSPWEHTEEFKIICKEKPALKVQVEVREGHTGFQSGPIYSHSHGRARGPSFGFWPWICVACNHVPFSTPACSGDKGPASESTQALHVELAGAGVGVGGGWGGWGRGRGDGGWPGRGGRAPQGEQGVGCLMQAVVVGGRGGLNRRGTLL